MGAPVVEEPFEIDLGHVRYTGVPVSMGNPHFVIFVPEFPANWQKDSQLIQARTDLFPEGINVEWVQFKRVPDIMIRIYRAGRRRDPIVGNGDLRLGCCRHRDAVQCRRS